MVLTDGTHHFAKLNEPEKYETGTFEQTHAQHRSRERLPARRPDEGADGDDHRASSREDMAELRAQNIHPHNQIMAWQKKFSIPAACLAFMLVALGLGVSNRRDGKLASFVVGIAVVFVYWFLMYISEAIAKGGFFPWWFAHLAMWVPNIVVAIWGVILIVRKLRAPEESSVRFALPFLRRRVRNGQAGSRRRRTARGTRVVVVIKVPQFAFPAPSILDWYVLKHGLRVSALAGSRSCWGSSTSRASSISRITCSRGARTD